jgi:hypothetical protein
MWWQHYRLFRPGSLIAWFGVLVVAQNAISSLLNSHLFDFAEGWIYVVGVGVAGGAMLKSERTREGASQPNAPAALSRR